MTTSSFAAHSLPLGLLLTGKNICTNQYNTDNLPGERVKFFVTIDKKYGCGEYGESEAV
jgi:hypothetical protein